MNRYSLWQRASVTVLVLASFGASASNSISSNRLRIEAQLQGGDVLLLLSDPLQNHVWADGPYLYSLLSANGRSFRGLANVRVRSSRSRLLITGSVVDTRVRVEHELTLKHESTALEERITLVNQGDQLELSDLAFGFQKQLASEISGRRWVAVPFRRQVDGKLHDFSVADLASGRFSNSSWSNDRAVEGQQLADEGKLRSEAWAWTDGRQGLLVAKYNPEAIEYSVASVERQAEAAMLRFGGAGLALYREPRFATRLPNGKRISFGVTRYTAFDGDWPEAYELYRGFLDAKGHALPPDYDPPLNWNELFDVGWYHSDRQQLFRHYTREALFREAAKAREIGCDLLYLDPGWEVCEGTTLWDDSRLGNVTDFSRELRERFGLKLGYRTIGRVYRDEFPKNWYLRRQGQRSDYERPLLSSQPAAEPTPLAASDGRRNLALLPDAKASASSVISGFPELHTIEHLNDGYYNNASSWVSARDPSWVEVDLGAVYTVNEIALGSEHSVVFNDRAISKFAVLLATNYGADTSSPVWKKAFTYQGEPLHTTRHFVFDAAPARWARVVIEAAQGSTARIDELEIYEAKPDRQGTAPARRAPPKQPAGTPLGFWEVCTQSRDWQREKLKRILAVTSGGVDFMMFDEFDWRGPCFDPAHGHPVPSTPEGHVRAIYGLVEAMRQRYPHVLVEAHDPVWPWSARYLPTYFRQGFTRNRYQENWGFEFMWNPIEDLRSGRALCLYYYNLGCNIPLYDHITMEGDNDACLSFWWYASTVRHLGIGGKKGLNSPVENEARYAAYKKAVAEYNQLRPFYARGKFIGLDETAHLHLHPNQMSAVLNVFNFTVEPVKREVRILPARLGLGNARELSVEGAGWRCDGETLAVSFDLPPLSPAHALLQSRRLR